MCVVVCREAGDIVRLVARRRVGGDGEGRGHHVVPAGAGRRAGRLRPLLLRALQRRAGHGARARAERYIVLVHICLYISILKEQKT